MKLSERGARLIAEFEGFRSCPYRDAVGVWTIGYGSTKGVGPGTRCITKAQALARMKREVSATYGKAVDDLPVKLNQHQFDALTSFVYNVGPGGVASSTGIGAALRRGDFKRAADELLKWNKAGGRELEGLTRRRQAERRLFLTKPPIAYSAAERGAFDKLKRGNVAERKQARDYLDRQAREIQRLARARKDGWKQHDRGRRYKGIRARLRA